ncbi:MAG: phosphatase PAP2 family protein [Vicinamibacterales bacterium]
MKKTLVHCLCSVFLLSPLAAVAQDAASGNPPDAQQPVGPPAPPVAPAAPPTVAIERSFFKEVGSDYKRFFSKDTARVMGMMSVASIAAVPWDREGLREGLELPAGFFKPGKIAGSVVTQAGIGGLTWALGKAMDSDKAADVGRDIVRGQVLSQGLAQALKVIVHRRRPDGSNHAAFPSGHSASIFTTAAIIQRHFGWKAATPAYATGVYIALSRMSANRHHISDVVMGAGLGLAAGRTVTVHTVGQKLGVGVAPTQGGASLTFTRMPK